MRAFLEKTAVVLGHATAVVYVFMMTKQFFRPELPMRIVPFHVFITLALVFLFVPARKTGERQTWTLCIDLAVFALSVYLVVHYWLNTLRMQLRFDFVDPIHMGEAIAFWIGIPLFIEAVRRTVGWALVVVVVAFLIYGFGIVDLPGWLHFRGFGLQDYVEVTMLGTGGVFGVASNAMVTMVFYFVLFGAVFTATRGGDLFIDLALKASGRLVGGAAKAALIASALFGTISGSAVANVTSTGVLTIPLMKRTGYSPVQAGATEAVASSGGQLMPPIMGVAAFVMADLLGVPYTRIALSGLIPAIAFYFALFLNVDLLARKTGIGSVDAATLRSHKDLAPIGPRIHLLSAPITIIVCLLLGYSVPFSALAGTLAALLVPSIRRCTHYPLKSIYLMIISTARQMAKISVAVSAIGIIIAVSIQSGIAIRFVTLLANIGAENLFLSLFLVIAACFTLGLGMPTVAAYIISALILAPALVRLGVLPLAAHFFVLYYSVLSLITPPVCIAAFAAAGLADANPNKTGIEAFRLALVMFFIPFGFIQDSALLALGSPLEILVALVGLLCAAASWAIAVQGWLGRSLNPIARGVFVVFCIAIVFRPTMSPVWVIGVAGFIGVTLYYAFTPVKRPKYAT